MSSSDEDKMPLQPKGKKIYSDKYIRSSTPPSARRCKFCTLLLIVVIGLCFAILIIGVVAGVLLNNHLNNNEPITEPWMSKRLSSYVAPDSYTISLKVDLESLSVSGEESIIVDVKQDSNWILLQYLDMNISSEVIVTELASGDPVRVSCRSYAENDYFIIENDGGVFSRDCQYNVSLHFSYFLYSGGLSGFYNSSYKGDDGTTVTIATTQFEPTDARRAFPCFDEPEMKAVFTITITHPSNRIALSNMPVESKVTFNDNTTETRFQPSKNMSTYLVAFIVCNFESKSDISTNGVNVSVWSRPSLVNDTDYALSTAMKVLEYYQIFFAINYPLPKMDLVAIPDFRAGAMENWGLITYRETALLYNPDVSSASDQQWVAQVIAHEIAHQWFGNLVTMDWWQDLWLNEGFASYVEYLGTNVSEPSWHYLDSFITADLRVALEADGYNDTHPIIQPAETLSEINALFDSISYSKGASLIRMIAGFMGMDKFREGLTNYLNNHRYGNAKSSDLWSALEGVSGQTEYNLTEVMDTWTIQAGYPILNITTQDNYASIHVTQERFVTIPTETFAYSEFDYIWRIPFNYITDVETSGTIWVNQTTKHIVLSNGGSKWIKANKGQVGFYRVNYETSMWEILTSVLKANLSTFGLEDRANLLDDSISLSIAGMVSPMLALNLTSYLESETEYIPLRSGLLALSQIHTKLILTRVEGNFSKFLLCLIKNEIRNALLTWPNRLNESATQHLDNLKRTMVLKYALLYGDRSFGDMAYAQFQLFMENGTVLTPDLKDIIFTAGVKLGGEKEWNHLWKLYTTSNNPTEQAACLSALAYTEVPWLIKQYLDKSLSEVRSQDGLTVLRRLAVNVYAWPYLWDFFREHYDLLFSRYGTSLSFGRAITGAISHFSTQTQLDEVSSFFADRDPGSGEVALKSGIEQIKSNINWLAANLDDLVDWLENASQCNAA